MNECSKRKLKTQHIKKKNYSYEYVLFYNRDAPENNSSLCTTCIKCALAEITEIN